jgi:quercetin dioxygenase-like cupin family protein
VFRYQGGVLEGMDTASLSEESVVEAVEGVHLAQLATGEGMSVQHFDFEVGADVPEHDHEHEQAGFIYAGVLTFLIEGEEVVCEPGDSYVIPSNTTHGAENRGEDPVRGVDVFSPPRPNPDWQG